MNKTNETKEKIEVKCFGNFETFFQGFPIRYRYMRSKELIAYLVHKEGAQCSMGELAGALFEDEDITTSRRSQLRNYISDIERTLNRLGAQTILYKSYGMVAILPQYIKCDYYDRKRNGRKARSIYMGEYMAQYSWAEETIQHLDRLWLWNDDFSKKR